jgi:hypothetical protein
VRVELGAVVIDMMVIPIYTASASFVRHAQPAAAGCTLRSAPPCQISICLRMVPDGGVDGPPAPMVVSAGPIEISGGTQKAMLTPDQSGAYPQVRQPTMWGVTDTLSFTAAGDPQGVPGFSGSVAGPGVIRITEMASAPWPTTLEGVIKIHSAAGASLAWTGATSGFVEADLIAYYPDRITRASCRLPAMPGSAMIPPASLSDFQPASGGVILSADGTQSVRVGEFSVDLVLSVPPTSATGYAAAAVQFE